MGLAPHNHVIYGGESSANPNINNVSSPKTSYDPQQKSSPHVFKSNLWCKNVPTDVPVPSLVTNASVFALLDFNNFIGVGVASAWCPSPHNRWWSDRYMGTGVPITSAGRLKFCWFYRIIDVCSDASLIHWSMPVSVGWFQCYLAI